LEVLLCSKTEDMTQSVYHTGKVKGGGLGPLTFWSYQHQEGKGQDHTYKHLGKEKVKALLLCWGANDGGGGTRVRPIPAQHEIDGILLQTILEVIEVVTHTRIDPIIDGTLDSPLPCPREVRLP